MKAIVTGTTKQKNIIKKTGVSGVVVVGVSALMNRFTAKKRNTLRLFSNIKKKLFI